ncbi:MAG: hypothetical protein L3K17_06245 [Thermoplasmata archaeon]|nr:hypothetical protein [Thermoplasmata archaeon]
MRVRRASGGREGDLLQRAKVLRGRVDPLLPKLQGDAPADRFDKLRQELEEVRAARDDEHRLEKLGGAWRDPITRAFAGLLRYYLDPKQPIVAASEFPGGTISFAVLNGAPREAHIAVQQGDDPRRLLLGYLAWARKGLHFWATAEALYCTGRSPEPPAAFRAAQIESLPYRLAPIEGTQGLGCPHLRSGEHRPFVGVDWTGAGVTIRVCERCARDDRQLLSSLSVGVALPDAEGAFPVEASLNVACRDGASCVHAKVPELSRAMRRNYHLGRLSDAALLREYLAQARERLERVDRPLFVAAGVCYGMDRAAFLDALHATPEERRALETTLSDVAGLFEIDEAAASRALERLWPAHAEAIVQAIVPDPDRAQRLVREAKANPGRVSDLLRRAARETRERELLEELPQYDSLTSEASFADDVARTFRTQGPAEAAKRLLQRLPREGKERGLAYGMLLALDLAGPQRWQFTDTEQQFGESLQEAARRLLQAPPTTYHEALDGLLGRAGVANWGRRTAA